MTNRREDDLSIRHRTPDAAHREENKMSETTPVPATPAKTKQMILDGYEAVREQLEEAPPDAPNLAEARTAFDLIKARGGPRYIARIGRVSTKQVMVDMVRGICPACGSDQGAYCDCFIVEPAR